MATGTKKKARLLEPPDYIEEEALLEWHRVTQELSEAGKLDKTDRAIIVLYVQAWAIHRKAAAHVALHGPVVMFINKTAGPNPLYKVMKEQAQLLRQYLSDMGLAPITRDKVKKVKSKASNPFADL